jgi:1,4-dihydroxy-2-naphthoate octaprenyltransferase
MNKPMTKEIRQKIYNNIMVAVLLVCMLVGITGLCAAFVYRKWWIVIPLGVCCMPCAVYAGLYLLLG